MRQLIFAVALLFAINSNAESNHKDPVDEFIALEIEKLELEAELFGDVTESDEIVQIEDIILYELEEELKIGFDTKAFLPQGFDAREGMHDLDWSTIELYEVEEEDNFNFNLKKHLPKNFNPYHGMAICTKETLLTSNQ